ncbi:MAG: hypothetical protein ACRD97_12500, partial [Nitrososphaeraceae archaeon]
GLNCGPCLVILYGKNIDIAPIDLVGPTISITSKITAAAQSNQILVDQSVYDIFVLDYSFRNRFTSIKLPYNKWNYVDKSSGNIYKLYSYQKASFS